jgi:arsenite methyltransferase
MDATADEERIKEAVRETYGGIARRAVGTPASTSCCGSGPGESQARPAEVDSCCGPGPAERGPSSRQAASCCEPAVEQAQCGSAASRLYGAEELAGLPDSVTEFSLGCGNPTAIAELEPGEAVLDLGAGGGIDCFLAARQVGPEGRVIGLDMTPDMIRLARRNAKKLGATNVDFRYGEMEDIPLPDGSVDVILSNCVINLSPDKDAVFREAMRVLRPGGRVSISDIVINGQLPATIRGRLDAWAGCIAGALDEAVYLDKMRAAGFAGVEVASRDYVPISQAAEWDDVQAVLGEARLAPDALDCTVASIKVTAYKPGA